MRLRRLDERSASSGPGRRALGRRDLARAGRDRALACSYDLVPDRQQRHLVLAGQLRAGFGDALRVPVSLPVRLALEDGLLDEVEAAVKGAVERPAVRAVVERRLGRWAPALREGVAAERVRDPA